MAVQWSLRARTSRRHSRPIPLECLPSQEVLQVIYHEVRKILNFTSCNRWVIHMNKTPRLISQNEHR
ncbi:hypothetical protein ACS0TY_001038 [Phlomoides rotata]